MGESRLTFSGDHDACGVGFVAQLGGPASHAVVERGLGALARLAHRGGVDADGRSGDGAGLLVGLPKAFFRKAARTGGNELPDEFAVGMVFLQRGRESVAGDAIRAAVAKFDLSLVGWREVPTDPSILGPRSRESLPVVRQCFIAPRGRSFNPKSSRRPSGLESPDFELQLFRLRQELETISGAGYYCSLSSRTIVYKGLLTPEQLAPFYLDLNDPDFASAFVVFHQRYSTNTQPSWSLAQPFRFVAHNGEINTISSNRRWFQARGATLRNRLRLPGNAKLLQPGMSDSASFDNALEALVQSGSSLAAAALRLVPPAWEHDEHLDAGLREFLASHAPQQEPWDGPAALIFTDGNVVGAKLDRNGLRPLRYTLTSDGLLIVGSEVGIADLSDKQVVERQRLGPGEMLIADPATGTFFRPREVAALLPLSNSQSSMTVIPAKHEAEPTTLDANRLLAAFGWTEDQFRMLFHPLVEQGQEALWSMGDDAPPAFLSSLPRPLWDFCKQRFAQVTNPPIDPLRENHVMSLDAYLGKNRKLSSPVLDAGQMDAVVNALPPISYIDFTFEVAGGTEAALQALTRIREEARTTAASSGAIMLSDRRLGDKRAALPALLAASSVWRAMTEAGAWNVALIVETGQVVDTHHVALLVAVGASAVHPYLAMSMAARANVNGPARYRAGVEKGLRKVLARMGISTISSYRNSQLFETIGLDAELCEEFFADAGRTLGGKKLRDLIEDCITCHTAGFASSTAEFRDSGLYRFRHNGEQHASSPELVRRMHRFIKSPTPQNHAALSVLSAERKNVAVRDLLEVRPAEPLLLDEVESEVSLLSRFSTQAMSLGAISPEAHQTLAIAMNRLGGRSNTGEGGEDPSIYYERPEANNRVKQVASARFGVTAEYLVHADEIEIKMAQGSKPGEGGQLPSAKVTPYIARLRHAVPGTSLISPPPHHDIYSIEDLAQLIYDLRAVNPNARIGVKLVSSSGVGVIATGVAKAGADVITISGHDGGTGASPLTSIKNTGLPWEIGLRDAHTALVRAGLRARVRLRVDGGLKFARDVVVAAVLGAEEFGFGTAALLAIGCVMARQCHLNTCPVGIATQDEALRARFTGNPEMVETFFRALAADVRQLLAEMGAGSIDEVLGAVDRLQPRSPEAAQSVASLLQPIVDPPAQFPCPREDGSALHVELNRVVDDLESLSIRAYRFEITNEDRAVGAHFSGEVLRRIRPSFGLSGLEMSGVDCEFVGTAGQSFGAFLISGANFRLTGEANDYVGKGLCGGSIAITAQAEASRRGDVLVGNTVLYGATSGELFVAGRAGERFAVRNSGALAVVEGVGRHGCEYMTAGVALILGPAGDNFGAGMTGGLAYLLRADADYFNDDHMNRDSVRFATLEPQEEQWLRRILRRHLQLTGSPRAADLLACSALPLNRIEPLAPPCSIEDTWASILARLAAEEARSYGRDKHLSSERPVMQ
ncbi:MAG TPA: glutamate synthase large subunit [Candidatus Dormibacteraeota bacterium]|nr:glutamate synthase large subunit [Candidatus Dormibacteraeota bacterium]